MPSSLSERIAFINRKRELEQAMEAGVQAQEVETEVEISGSQSPEVSKDVPDIDVNVIQTKDVHEIKKTLADISERVDKIYEGLKSLGAIKETKSVKKGKK